MLPSLNDSHLLYHNLQHTQISPTQWHLLLAAKRHSGELATNDDRRGAIMLKLAPPSDES